MNAGIPDLGAAFSDAVHDVIEPDRHDVSRNNGGSLNLPEIENPKYTNAYDGPEGLMHYEEAELPNDAAFDMNRD